MSVVYYCDICGEPTTKSALDRIEVGARSDLRGGLMFQIIVGKSPTWNAGHFHHACIAHEIARHFGVAWDSPTPATRASPPPAPEVNRG